jgi:hypothetical protein
VIAGPTPRAAAQRLRRAVQQAVSCVTTGVLVDDRGAVTNELRLVGRLAPRAGGHVVLLLSQRCGLVAESGRDRRDQWQARTAGYLYAVEEADGREILAYHWHPAGRSPQTRPHLHLGAGAGSLRSELSKAHLGTGFVTPAAVLRLSLESFYVRPRRADWAAILDGLDDALSPP